MAVLVDHVLSRQKIPAPAGKTPPFAWFSPQHYHLKVLLWKAM